MLWRSLATLLVWTVVSQASDCISREEHNGLLWCNDRSDERAAFLILELSAYQVKAVDVQSLCWNSSELHRDFFLVPGDLKAGHLHTKAILSYLCISIRVPFKEDKQKQNIWITEMVAVLIDMNKHWYTFDMSWFICSKNVLNFETCSFIFVKSVTTNFNNIITFLIHFL